MKKSLNLTLILLGCLVLLMGWYLGYEKKLRPQHEQAEEKAKELVSLERTAISEIVLTRAKNALTDADGKAAAAPAEVETVTLKKNGLDWNLTAPITYPGDNTQVDSLVTTAVTTKWDRVVDEHPKEKDLEEFGLKTPLIKATFKAANVPEQTILIGRDTPTGNSVYVKLEGKEPVYRVSRIARTSFEKPVKDLRDKTVLSVSQANIAEVEVSSGKETVLVKKDEKGNWLLPRDGMPADGSEWNKTLNAVIDAKAKDFLDTKDLKKYGLQPPAAKVAIEKTDKSKLGLSVGKAGDKTYAKVDGKDVVFEIEKDVLTKLQQPASTYTDRRVAQFNRFDAIRLRLTRSDGVVELVKDTKKSEWSLADEQALAEDKRTAIDKAKVDLMLTSLQDMKAEKFVKAHSKVEKPTVKLELWENGSKAEEPKVVLNLVKEGKGAVGERGGLPVPFQISEADYKKIDVGKKDLTKEKKENSDPKKSASQTPEKGKS